MPDRTHQSRLLLLAAAMLLSGPASAQVLDFGKPTRPPSSGPAAEALAAEMRAQAQRVAGPTINGQCKAALRALAERLLTTGDAMGAAGSRRVLLGRTLVRGLPELDAMIDAGNPERHVIILGYLAHDIGKALKALEDTSAEPARILRDALGTLGMLVPSAAWTAPQLPDDPALKPLQALLDTAAGSPPHQPWADRLAAIVSAAREVVHDKSVRGPAAAELQRRYKTAIERLSEADASDEPIHTLRFITALGAMAQGVGQLDSRDAMHAESALARAIADWELDQPRIRDLQRLVDLALARQQLPEDRQLLRTLRPAFRILLQDARASEQRVIAAITAAIPRPQMMSDPGTLAAVGAHRRAIDDLRQLVGASQLMSGDSQRPGAEPEPAPEWKRIADRLLKLGQDMGKPEAKEAALEALRELSGCIVAFAVLPGEAEMRAMPLLTGPEMEGPVMAASGGVAGDILDHIAAARQQWRALVLSQRAEQAAEPAAVLEALAVLCPMIADMAALGAGREAIGPHYEMLLRRPEWELSRETLGALMAGFSAKAREAWASISTRDLSAATLQLEQMRSEFAAPLLAGRLLRPHAGAQPPPFLQELTWPPALSESEEALADVCRFAEELAAVRKLGNAARAGEIQAYIARRAMAAPGESP